MSKTPKPSTEITTHEGLQGRMAELDAISKNCQLSAQTGDEPFSAALKTADAIVQLRAALDAAAMATILELMNTPLGFLTDRNGKPNWKGETKPLYTADEIRDAVIEATLRGFYVVGNEFNVIAHRFYAAKAGLRRKVMQFPGVSEFRDVVGVPRVHVDKGGAVVTTKATWKLNGELDSFEAEFAVKGDQYAGADSYAGKAERKMLNRILARLSGISTPEGEVGDVPEHDATPATPARNPDAPAPAAGAETATTAPQEAPTVDQAIAAKAAKSDATKADAAKRAEKSKAAASSQAVTPPPAPAKVPKNQTPPLPAIGVIGAGESYMTVIHAIEAAGISEKEICESAFQSMTFTNRPEDMLIANAPVEEIATLARVIDHEIKLALKRRTRDESSQE
jgi:hypothetical protein